MKTKITLFFFLLTIQVLGQHFGNVWQFGNHAGIDFNGCNPVPLMNGSNSGFEGCSSISDSTGQLLFYTNSDTVWNRFGNAMPNGYLGNTSGTLSQVIIVPKPGSPDLFFIITTVIQGNGQALQYHVVDMSLNGGLGDVANKNNILPVQNITEQIAASYHSNGTDIWLITHAYGSPDFISLLITSNGISLTPVISTTGPAQAPCLSNINARGEIKISPDGSKLAFNANGIGPNGNTSNDSTNLLILCDFNNNTGVVSAPVMLPFSRGDFGLSFSPDNSKLYGSTWKAFGFTSNDYNYLYQFDLSSGVDSIIVNSKQIIDSGLVSIEKYGDLKIGPDGKIYVANYGSLYLGVINYPNQPGLACGYIKNGFYLNGKTCQYGLNNYIEYQNYCEESGISEMRDQSIIQVFPNPVVDFAVIKLPELKNQMADIKILDGYGKLVMAFPQFTRHELHFNRGDLSAGIYYLQLNTSLHMYAVKKIILK